MENLEKKISSLESNLSVKNAEFRQADKKARELANAQQKIEKYLRQEQTQDHQKKVIISHSGMHQSATRKTVIRIKERTNPKQGTHRSAQGTHLQMVSQQNKCFHGFHRNGAERNGGGNRENGDIHTLRSFCTDWQ